MNAAVIPAVGAPLRTEELRHPEPQAGEARIRIAACGVCHSDLHVARGHLKFPMPCVPGHEISGTIDDQGHGLFTYFLLKGLNGAAANVGGHVSAKSLYDYLRPRVQDAARRDNRDQTPQLAPASLPSADIRIR